jgi:hypothetical protein
MSFGVKVDARQVFAELDAIAGEVEQAVRPAAQAMAQVLYDEVLRNVNKIKRKTGNLSRSIYQAYSEENSGPGKATYHISWNAKKAPHGHLVEYGHLQRYLVTNDPQTGRFITHRDKPLPVPKQIPAKPFVRPAVVKFPQAQQAGVDRLIEELQKRGVIQ